MHKRLWSNVAQYVGPQPTSPQFLSDLDHAVALGMRGVRIDCVPGYTQNGHNLVEVTAKVHACAARHLDVSLMCPHWLASKAQVPDWATLTAFAGLVARAFPYPTVKRIEVGNEPGSPPFTGNQKPDPIFQANVTKAFLDGGFAAWNGQLITPGLAPVSGSGYVEIDAFITPYWAALDTGHQARIDFAGVHIYSPPTPSDRSYFKSWAQLDRLHSVTGKPIVVTELNVLGATGTAQANGFTAQLNALNARPDIDSAYLYEMSNQGSETGYGAYDPHGNPALVAALQAWHTAHP